MAVVIGLELQKKQSRRYIQGDWGTEVLQWGPEAEPR